MKSTFLIIIFALFSIPTLVSQAAEAWRVEPDFRGKKARNDISGAACGPSRCIVINDETHFAQEFTLNNHRLTPGDRIKLADKGEEIDAEAIAYGDGQFYITGSHGLSRKKGKDRPATFQVFRLDGDEITASKRLREAIENAPHLGKYAGKRLDKNGANIEGLAVKEDRLFFGFRGPSVAGEAFILETSAVALFSDDVLDPKIHVLSLGQRIGIRDLASVEDGILILTGPVNTLPRDYTVALWKSGSTIPKTLAEIPTKGKGKPEGILILNESDSAYNVLIFMDSSRNGTPFELAIDKF